MNLTPRVLANLLVFVSILALVVPARAEGGITISGTEIPWGVISSAISAVAAIVALLVRSSLTTMKIEINSQMTKALETALEKGRAEGALDERHRSELTAAARASGVAEEKGRTDTPPTGGSS